MAGYDEISVPLSGGYQAYARYWKAEASKGCVLYHHGIQSHCGWYDLSAARLMDAGFDVLQVDRRGSGRNSRNRGHAESAEQLLDDAHIAGRDLVQRSGWSRYHVVGVSWGGKLAVAAHVRFPDAAASLTLVTPGIFPRIGVSRPVMAKIGFAMIYEPHTLFDIPLNDPDLFTKDPKRQEFFRKDELTLRQCTAAFYLASRRMDRIVAQLKDSRPVPIHLLVAGEERIIDNEKTIEFIESLAWPGTRVSTYPEARHCLEFDVPDPYLRELTAFMTDANDQSLARPD